jgi:methanogenic corrinoid protein MtbC1
LTEKPFRFRPIDANAFLRAQSVISAHQSAFPEPALRVLTQEVLSRLARRLANVPLPADLIPQVKIDEFCNALLADDDEPAHELIAKHRREGASLETVYLGYIARAARRLGERWDLDEVTFMEVTIAAGRMFAIMRGLHPVIVPEPGSSDRHALFASVPGETHTIGISMAADMFRQRGWRIDLETGRDHDELVAALENSNHRIIGLSASGAEQIVALARLVIALRICKPHCVILASGQITEEVADLANLTGVDIVVGDIHAAIAELEQEANRAASLN